MNRSVNQILDAHRLFIAPEGRERYAPNVLIRVPAGWSPTWNLLPHKQAFRFGLVLDPHTISAIDGRDVAGIVVAIGDDVVPGPAIVSDLHEPVEIAVSLLWGSLCELRDPQIPPAT